MKSSLRAKLNTSSRWPSTLVICLTIVVSSAATATAGKLITGAQIKNNSITGADIKDGSLSAKDLASGTLTAGPAGAKGADGKNGQDGLAGADGSARAYASVITGDPPVFGTGKMKGFVGITVGGTGAYCLELDSSIDASTVTPVATVDYWNSPAEVTFVEVHAAGTDCHGTNEIEIITRASNGTDFANNVGFHVIVP